MRDTYLADIRRSFRNYRQLAETALAQIDDAHLTATLGTDDNSIAVIMQHVAGNLRSRFTGFLTADGEKPDRDRDAEFEGHPRAFHLDSTAILPSNLKISARK